ncbi:hypothetical protein NE237_006003 [Protea cynaroides]|uniref:Uncharacterized protein n=1 Tax=Protea cynaroides TaxID=273540 RepID=A0A9Q0KLS1_9MAGN|nr:hypothetical protein NE237_006003 [Protea cynaroides]
MGDPWYSCTKGLFTTADDSSSSLDDEDLNPQPISSHPKPAPFPNPKYLARVSETQSGIEGHGRGRKKSKKSPIKGKTGYKKDLEKVRQKNEGIVSNHIAPGWKYIHNGDWENPSRIWVGWNQINLDLEVLSISKYLIHTKITTKSSKKVFLCTTINGANSRELRLDLWREIHSIQNQAQLLWVLLGDFNVVRFGGEKVGGDFPNEEALEDFNNSLDRNSLTDLSWKGQLLTWSSGRKGNTRVCSKLDRCLVNLSWLNHFCFSLTPGISDHSPCILPIGEGKKFGPKPFKLLLGEGTRLLGSSGKSLDD